MDFDTIIIGGGLVGAALAWGLARRGGDVAVLDEGDAAFRASAGNFGLIWVQSKGLGMPAYAAWSRRSADLWPDFAARLEAEAGFGIDFARPGGLTLCLGEAELAARAAFVERMRDQQGAGAYGARLLDRDATRALVPRIGPLVTGASFCPDDGHVNPLLLLRALHAAGRGLGLAHLPGAAAAVVARRGAGYRITRADGATLDARRVLLAAGLGNAALAEGLGKAFPVRPQLGQILVTQRTERFLNLPLSKLRQTAEGGVMIGDSKADAGFDTRVRARDAAAMAARAARAFPHLADVAVARAWGALRVMSPDGFPIYQTWPDLPGLFALGCHSGVTLAAIHAEILAPAIAAGGLPEETAPFSADRFELTPDAKPLVQTGAAP